jgi:predicted phage-related endonuclease
MIVYHDVKQGSPEWHKLRKELWTGSRAIKLLQGKPLPDDSNVYESPAMRRGSALEPIAIQEYAREVGRKIERPGFATNSVYPNAGYSPDGVDGKILLEVKCCNGVRHEDLVKGDIPLEYLVQIYFGMIITGLRKAKLLAFNPEYSQQLTIIDIPYDKGIGNNIRKKLKLDMKNRQPI